MDLSVLLTKTSDLLKGEPARVIGYGAAVIVFLAAKAIGAIPDQSLDQSIVLVASSIALIASVVESIRHLVTPAAKSEALVAAALAINPDDIVVEVPNG